MLMSQIRVLFCQFFRLLFYFDIKVYRSSIRLDLRSKLNVEVMMR
jgi:hypothetical protein